MWNILGFIFIIHKCLEDLIERAIDIVISKLFKKQSYL